MVFDPNKRKRRSIRMPGYDYSRAGAYFVTISTHGHESMLGEVVDGQVFLSDAGRVVQDNWLRIPRHFDHVRLDAWVIMPNHVHGIIVITYRGLSVGASHSHASSSPIETDTPCTTPEVNADDLGNDSPLQQEPRGAPPGSLGAMIGNFKSVAARRINRLRRAPGQPVWQRNYYERVVRNERELRSIRRYIVDNPLKWDLDRENPAVAAAGRGGR